MAGSTPHSSYPYSPTHSTNRPFFPQDYNNASTQNHQSPPSQYPPHSPRRPLTLTSPLPAPNTLSQPAGSHPYQSLPSSPPYQAQRTYQGPLASHNMPTQYGTATSNHAHPPNGHVAILNSPVREHHPITNGSSRDSGASEARPPSSDVSSENLFHFRWLLIITET